MNPATDRLSSCFTDKHVVIAGASSGLGKLIAQQFVAQGAKVWNIDRNPSELSGVHDMLCDICHHDQLARVCQSILQEAKSVHIYIANAAVYLYQNILSSSQDDLHELFSINVFAHYQIIQQLLPVMLEIDMAHIVLIGSDQAMIGRANNTIYAMTKASLAQLTRSLAAELNGHSIAVNCICPGSMKNTGMTDAAASIIAVQEACSVERVLEEFAKEMPQKQLIDPVLVAEWVVMLCQQRSPLLTGQCLALDGGFVCLRL